METFEATTSFCPTCRKVIAADIFENNGMVFMKKTCPEHGSFEVKIAQRAWYYRGLNNYYNNLYKYAPIQKTRPLIYSSLITSRCNLRCPTCFCFANLPDERRADVTLDFFKENLKKIKKLLFI